MLARYSHWHEVRGVVEPRHDRRRGLVGRSLNENNGPSAPPRCWINWCRCCCNRPFPSSCLPPLQSESKCEVFLKKISFHSYVKQN